MIPTAKSILLCDRCVSQADGKIDLLGAFNGIRPKSGYPHIHERFCVYAQLTDSLGDVPFFFDIRFLETDELIWTTETRILKFPDRMMIVHLACSIEGCRFEKPGLYVVELFCDNQWVCDTRVMLR
ncbi:DUF6941 family protein [Zavarzinella formosa]|uniref:DUF6941 family protein n=1 Tax=Zavarzinella formosa TaxID=360055 RepID=UPI0012FA9C90|nr:hypothetical protein [Zavarzinella formosa]